MDVYFQNIHLKLGIRGVSYSADQERYHEYGVKLSKQDHTAWDNQKIKSILL